jgi:protein-S-isoprenylcysteine O-methyltransferase Ste14
MLIRDRLLKDGEFLFRWRSYVPLALLPLIIIALPEEDRIASQIGHRAEHVIFYLSVLISLSGLALRWLTVGCVRSGTSGRNTRAQRADSLNTSGMYSVVRNPLYLGNFIAMLGVLVCVKVWWLVAIFAVSYWLYIERVVAAEEAFLEAKFGDAYREWARATPAFIPRFSSWRPPQERFSLRSLLRREYNGLLAVGASFFALEFVLDVFVQGEPVAEWLVEDFAWAAFGLATLVVFVSLWLLKTRTRVLHQG